MTDKENGQAKKSANDKEPSSNTSSGESPSLEPIEACARTSIEVKEENNHSVVAHGTENKASISENTLIDRIRRSDRWMISLTLAIVIVSAISGVISYFQWRTMNGQLIEMGSASTLMKGQLDEMVAQQRPWISVDVNIVRPIRFSEWNGDKSIFVPLQFSLKNFGLSPATNINIMTRVWPHPGNANPGIEKLNAAQDDLCSSAEKLATETKRVGVTIFPSEPKIIQSGASGPIFKTDKPDIISVEGCVDYTYADNRHGKTGFRMILGRVVGNRVIGLNFIKGVPEKDYHPSLDLLKSGFPAKPPNVALLYPGNYLFRPDEGGNYAK